MAADTHPILADVKEQIEGLDFADDRKREGAEESILCTVETLIGRVAAKDAEIAALKQQLAEAWAQFIASPAECDQTCDDRGCPYSHLPITWKDRAEAAEANLATVEAERDDLAIRALTIDEALTNAIYLREATESANKRLRAETIEECAKVAESFNTEWPNDAHHIAGLIRALAGKTGGGDG